MHLNGVPLLAMKEKTAKVLLGKYLTSKPGTSPKPKDHDVAKKQNRPSGSPLPE